MAENKFIIKFICKVLYKMTNLENDCKRDYKNVFDTLLWAVSY